jgi:centromeric protein E
LASAAAVELKNLAEEVKKLSLQNSQLANDLITVQEASFSRLSRTSSANGSGYAKKSHMKLTQERGWTHRNLDDDVADIDSWELDPEDVKMELKARKEREEILEAALSDKERVEAELRKKLEDAKQREADLENDLAGMWVTVAQLKMEKRTLEDSQADRKENRCTGVDALKPADELQCALEEEKQRNSELRKIVSRLKVWKYSNRKCSFCVPFLCVQCCV